MTVPAPAQSNSSHFTAKAKAKVEAAQAKASRDFRSDVVTVPTEGMLDVSLAVPWFDQTLTNNSGYPERLCQR